MTAQRISMTRQRPQQNLVFVIVLVVIALLVAVAVIIISSNSGGAIRDYSNIPQSRTDDGAFVLGSPNAPITIVEFADFTCPHCQEYEGTIDRLINDFVVTGRAKLEYRFFPIVHPQYAVYTAQLAECTEELAPGSFWTAHDVIFQLASTGRYDAMGPTLAGRFGFNYSALLECSSSARQYATDMRLGQEMGVQGTPAIMVREGDGPLRWLGGGQPLRGGVGYSILEDVVLGAQ